MKTQTAQPTPTPWISELSTVYKQDKYDGDASDTIICSVINRPDAAFIVRAVNAHEYLLKSAKLSMELFAELQRTMDEGHWFANDLKKIGEALFEAIAKAEGR